MDVQVHVRPGARRTELAGLHDGVLAVRLAAPAVDGRANEALVAALAHWLAVRPSAVSIHRGHHARRKTVRIEGLDAESLAALLDRARSAVDQR